MKALPIILSLVSVGLLTTGYALYQTKLAAENLTIDPQPDYYTWCERWPEPDCSGDTCKIHTLNDLL